MIFASTRWPRVHTRGYSASKQSSRGGNAVASDETPGFGGVGTSVDGHAFTRAATPKANDVAAAVTAWHLLALTMIAVALMAATPRAGNAESAQVSVGKSAALPTAPDDAAWSSAPVGRVPLVLQDMVEPRLLVASTPEVRVRALSDGAKIAFLLEWDDATADDVTMPAQFPDACAVQLPSTTSADVPAPQMGEPGRPVEISYWRASWQAMADGRADDVQAVHARSTVDHYPFEAEPLKKDPTAQQEMAKRYAPARNVGNTMAGPRSQPVEDLIAEGPGSLSPAPKSQSTGTGKRSAKGWSVMLARPLPAGFAPGTRTQVAFAVWDGSHTEVGARKMRSAWLPLSWGASK